MRKFSFKLRMLFWNFSRTWLVLKCNFWEWKKDQNQTWKISINHMLLLVSHTWLVFYHESSSSSPQYLSLISRLCISAHAPFFICTRIKKIFLPYVRPLWNDTKNNHMLQNNVNMKPLFVLNYPVWVKNVSANCQWKH